MTRTGQTLTNAATGERIVFLTVPDDRNRAFVFEDHWAPGHRVPAHIHPEMDERWEVVAGNVTFRIGGVERSATAGDVVEAPAGTPHMAWGADDGPVVLRVTIAPALRWPEFIDEMFELAERGLTDEAGLPPDRTIVELMSRYPKELAPPEPVR